MQKTSLDTYTHSFDLPSSPSTQLIMSYSSILFKLHLVLILGFVLLPNFGYSQAYDAQELINQQVWTPFMENYTRFDAEGFMAIHTEDVIRVSQDGNKIYIGQEYSDRIHSSFGRMKASETSRTIEFRFLKRLAYKDVAYEVGYYKIQTQKPGDQLRTYFGKFHVTLRLVEGKWKIAVDSDSSNNNSITEEDFLTGEAL